jgi:hypothetical protein
MDLELLVHHRFLEDLLVLVNLVVRQHPEVLAPLEVLWHLELLELLRHHFVPLVPLEVLYLLVTLEVQQLLELLENLEVLKLRYVR